MRRAITSRSSSRERAGSQASGLGRVHQCDDNKQLVFGELDNEPLNDYDGKLELGSNLIVSYASIREHKKGGWARSTN